MSLVGRTIGRYRVTDRLGEGGMGVVYRAQDATLGRDVAIKVLRPELGRQPERVRRFSQEARAASALNHPNIITVHDAGEFEDGPFLVMELVEGESLRALVRRGPVALAKVLDIGTQAATALARAHESGITHRDLKPENLLVRPDGYVKILDFGLAKLKEKEPAAESASDATTVDAGLTREGSILGTAAYMSPEQATGRPVDGRSDIFSLALVLLECWQGSHPFLRGNILDTLHAIAHDRLPAPAHPPGTVEWGLLRVLEKALEKETDERYQTMKDLGIDLRRLRQESEPGRLPPVAAAGPARRAVIYGAVGLVLLTLLAGAGWLLFRSRQPAAPPRLEYTQLTNFADSATSPALSPDGRMLAFIRGESTFVGPGQIYVKLLPAGESLQLTHDDLPKMSPKFSPDGARIAYTVEDGSGWNTWVVPVLGGQPRLFLANAEGLTWIATGATPPRILFSEMTGRGQQMGIVTSRESRAEQRTVYMPPEESGMAHRSYLSPGGKHVLVVEMKSSRWLPCRLTPFDGSSPGTPVGPAPAQCTDAAWSPDGKWMYFSANTGNGFHIWRQRFPDGALQQITTGATEEEGIELAPDGRSFVTSIGASQSTLWVHDSRGDRQITSEGFAIFPSLSPDGKKLYHLLRAEGAMSIVGGELWVADLDSGQRQRLLPDFLMRHYTISADGERVVFVVADDTGRYPVWVAALNRRSPPRQVTASDARKAFFGPSGDVLFLGQEKDTNFLFRVREDGSESPKVIATPQFRGRQIFLAANGLSVSSDGNWVVEAGPTEDLPAGVVVYATVGGSPRLVCEKCAQFNSFERGPQPPFVNWSPDGKFLYLSFHGSIYAIPLRPGQVLPPVPASGFRTREDVVALPGARLIAEGAFPGANPSVYAFTRFSIHRNIYRVPVP